MINKAIKLSLCAILTLPSLALPAIADSGSHDAGQLRSKHLIYGIPRYKDNRHEFSVDGQNEDGISILVREGFVVGHYDKWKIPAWVSLKWTEEDFDESEAIPKQTRPFASDEELPEYAQAGTLYDFKKSRMDRGHLARHEDNKAWGQDNSANGCLMSNIVPQHEKLNRRSWLALENYHRNLVKDEKKDIREIWVISGPIFDSTSPKTVGNKVGVPDACFKIVAWMDDNNKLNTKAFILKQSDWDKTNLKQYLCSVDDIEKRTGLDFFPELDPDEEKVVESATATSL